MIRCTIIMLLGLIGRRWALGYVVADLGAYLFTKILRRVFWYWIPAGNAKILSSFLLTI